MQINGWYDMSTASVLAVALLIPAVTLFLVNRFWVGRRSYVTITGKEISEALMAQFGLDVGKQKIVLDEPIKAFGSYEIRAKLGYEVSGKFTVTVAEE